MDRNILSIAAAGCLGLGLLMQAGAIQAQSWPERTVRIVNPFPVGSGSDLAARVIAEKLAGRFGKPFIVDNRPGGNAIPGTDVVAKAAPDGYTYVAGGVTTHAANAALFKSLPFDPVKDFAPVAFMVSLNYYLVVAGDGPHKSARDLVAYAKANPGKVNYGTGSAISTIAAEMYKLATGTPFVQVNYKGNPLAANDVMANTITMMFLDTSTAFPFIQGGKMKALAIAAGKRSDIFPDVPTVAESGASDINITAWNAIWAPAGTPRPIIDSFNAGMNAARTLPDVQKKFRDLGLSLEGPGQRPEDLGNYTRSEIDFWKRMVAQFRIEVQ